MLMLGYKEIRRGAGWLQTVSSCDVEGISKAGSSTEHCN
jgi:hypothetical protein